MNKFGDGSTETIENSVGKGESLTLGFPTDFLQSSTPEVDKSAGGNASAFQDEINKQNSKEKTQGAISALLRDLCPNCFATDKYCLCTGVDAGGNASAFQEEINKILETKTPGAIAAPLKNVCNANNTTGSKNGFKDGVKPSGPAFRRKCKKK